jgi:hypothetical protein
MPFFNALLPVLLLTLASSSKALDLPPGITVHLICHTHDDVGWLKTPEQVGTAARATTAFTLCVTHCSTSTA